jgi:hypothetical protein
MPARVLIPQRPSVPRAAVLAVLLTMAVVPTAAEAAAGRRWSGPRSAASLGTPRRQADYQPGRSPYVTGHSARPKYFVPPTNPGTPTWKMYGLPPGVAPGDWPSYAPFGFGGYRFPAAGPQAYR